MDKNKTFIKMLSNEYYEKFRILCFRIWNLSPLFSWASYQRLGLQYYTGGDTKGTTVKMAEKSADPFIIMQQGFYAVRCTKCGKYSGTEIKEIKKKVFKCNFCNHSLKLKKVNEFALTTKVSGPYSSHELPIAVQKLNIPRGKK